MEDILLSHKQYHALLKRLDEINEDVSSMKFRSVPDVGFIDTYELLKLLLVSIRTLQRWRKSGRLPYSKIGGKYYYKADIILDCFKINPNSPVEVQYPPPVIENLVNVEQEMTCKRCPLFLLLTS